MMPTFPPSPLSFRTAGFPQYGWKMCISDGTCLAAHALKLAPSVRAVTCQFVTTLRADGPPFRSSSESGKVGQHRHRKVGPGQPAPQGSSLRSGLFCPSPSSLNQPHPPHLQARPDFAAVRLIQNAFAVRERLSDLRVVPSFHCLFCTNMSPSMTPEVQWLHPSSSFATGAGLRMDLKRSASSTLPQIRFPWGTHFGVSRFASLRPVRLFASLGGSDRVAPANRDFYFQASDDWVTRPHRWI